MICNKCAWIVNDYCLISMLTITDGTLVFHWLMVARSPFNHLEGTIKGVGTENLRFICWHVIGMGLYNYNLTCSTLYLMG